MSDRLSIECPECRGGGVDESDTPVIVVIQMDGDGTTKDTPCAMCFGRGTINVRTARDGSE